MATAKYYRGGSSLVPRPIDVMIDVATGLLSPTRGVSVSDRPEKVERFGGAYEVGDLPETLHVVKTGKKGHHFEIAPARPMTLAEYEQELSRVSLTPF